MNNLLILLFFIYFTNTIFAIDKYSKNDILYVIGDRVNVRAEPNLGSSVIKQLSKGSSVISLQSKQSKSGDDIVGEGKDWKKLLTGKWLKVKQNGKIGFVFDVYLSHYKFDEIGSLKFCFSHDTLRVEDFELYTRTVGINGTVVEIGSGMEWGLEIYFIPDFSIEEALLFLNPGWIDYKGGEQNWIITETKIVMKEEDSGSYRNFEIIKYGEYVLIKNSGGV